MRCSNCGKKVSSSSSFCRHCRYAIQIPAQEPKKTRKRFIWIVLLVILCVVAAAAIYFGFFFKETSISLKSFQSVFTSPNTTTASSKATAAPAATPPPAYSAPEKIITLQNSLNIEAEPKFVAGDFNSDGYDDVAILWMTWLETNDFKMVILLNDRKGGLRYGNADLLGSETIQTLFVPYPDTMVVVEDLNADGKNDVYIGIAKNDAGGYTGYQNALFLTEPDGLLHDATATLPPKQDFPHSIASADIDADGDIDIYTGNIWSSEDIAPYLLINDGSGRFSIGKGRLPAQLRLGENGYTASVFADVNNDSYPDLILGDADDTMNNQYSSRDSLVLLNNGEGKFSLLKQALPEKSSTRSLVLSIVPTDLNADGWIDLLFVFTDDYEGRFFKAYINNQDGTFHDESTERLPGASNPNLNFCYRLILMDVDHDGDSDLVAKIWDDRLPTPLLLVNDGNGYFSPKVFPVRLDTLYFTFLDVDRDGGNDIIYGYYGATTDIYLLRDQMN